MQWICSIMSILDIRKIDILKPYWCHFVTVYLPNFLKHGWFTERITFIRQLHPRPNKIGNIYNYWHIVTIQNCYCSVTSMWLATSRMCLLFVISHPLLGGSRMCLLFVISHPACDWVTVECVYCISNPSSMWLVG